MPSENVALAREAYDAFNRRDLDAVLERLDPAIEWRMHESFTRVPRVYTGHAGVREVFAAFDESFERFRTEPQEFIELNGRMVVRVRMVGSQRDSGTRFELELVHVWTVRNRMATALDVYSTIEEALGSVDSSGG